MFDRTRGTLEKTQFVNTWSYESIIILEAGVSFVNLVNARNKSDFWEET